MKRKKSHQGDNMKNASTEIKGNTSCIKKTHTHTSTYKTICVEKNITNIN